MKKGYWIVSKNINCTEKHKEYGIRSKPAIEPFGAKILVRSGVVKKKFEGVTHQAYTLVEFPSYEDAIKAYNSKEYQNAKKHRDGHVDFNIAIVEGI